MMLPTKLTLRARFTSLAKLSFIKIEILCETGYLSKINDSFEIDTCTEMILYTKKTTRTKVTQSNSL